MNALVSKSLLDLVTAVLSDENGVSEEAYFHLVDLREALKGTETGAELAEILRKTDGTDGRIYLPE